jgi:homoserine O-succinyltransferase/O-acetyltransferase
MGPVHAGDSTRWGDSDPIVIGLVNNMPDAALRQTEQQFRALLTASPIGQRVRLRPLFLPEIPRSETALLHLMQHYQPIDALWDSQVDGLIVTGAEPRALMLTDEAYWDNLTKVVDWAENRTVSAIWSCLAAHATVRHLDGIDRRALGKKLFGVFDCVKVADHPILAGVPSQWQVPHSRHNGLPEDLLGQMGYRLLSTSPEAGADVFVREQGSLFVFLNGHPEYQVDALFREYRRDVIRFLSGEQENYPEVPSGYFVNDTTEMLAAFRQRAVQHRSIDLAVDLPAIGVAIERLPHAWHDVATLIFRNWLLYLVANRSRSASSHQCASVEMQPLHETNP